MTESRPTSNIQVSSMVEMINRLNGLMGRTVNSNDIAVVSSEELVRQEIIENPVSKRIVASKMKK